MNSILQSLDKSVSINQFEKLLGQIRIKETYIPSLEEVKVIDMASLHFYLTDLAREAGKKFWKIDAQKAQSILKRLKIKGIVDISYWFLFREVLKGVTFLLNGPQERVCSLVLSLLKYTPSCRIYITDDGENAIVVARVSEDALGTIDNTLPHAAKESGINLRYMFPSSFRNYSTDFFQRLLKSDGLWNEDVSTFLSQVRSSPKSVKDHDNLLQVE